MYLPLLLLLLLCNLLNCCCGRRIVRRLAGNATIYGGENAVTMTMSPFNKATDANRLLLMMKAREHSIVALVVMVWLFGPFAGVCYSFLCCFWFLCLFGSLVGA
jgi:hypothetical protein